MNAVDLLLPRAHQVWVYLAPKDVRGRLDLWGRLAQAEVRDRLIES